MYLYGFSVLEIVFTGSALSYKQKLNGVELVLSLIQHESDESGSCESNSLFKGQ